MDEAKKKRKMEPVDGCYRFEDIDGTSSDVDDEDSPAEAPSPQVRLREEVTCIKCSKSFNVEEPQACLMRPGNVCRINPLKYRGDRLHPTARSTVKIDDGQFLQPNRDSCLGKCCYSDHGFCEHNDPAASRRLSFTVKPVGDQEKDTADRGKHHCYGFMSDYHERSGFSNNTAPEEDEGSVTARSKYLDD
jgi:hypothetical protein